MQAPRRLGVRRGDPNPGDDDPLADANALPKLLAVYLHEASSEDLKTKAKRALKAVIQKCVHLPALEPLLHDAPETILKYVVNQFAKVLPHDVAVPPRHAAMPAEQSVGYMPPEHAVPSAATLLLLGDLRMLPLHWGEGSPGPEPSSLPAWIAIARADPRSWARSLARVERRVLASFVDECLRRAGRARRTRSCDRRTHLRG